MQLSIYMLTAVRAKFNSCLSLNVFLFLRFEMSSPESLPRDPDFGYEVIEEGKKNTGEQNITIMDVDDESSVSVADHYRGTPPLRGKKKKPPYRNDKNLGDPVIYLF